MGIIFGGAIVQTGVFGKSRAMEESARFRRKIAYGRKILEFGPRRTRSARPRPEQKHLGFFEKGSPQAEDKKKKPQWD